MEIKDALDIMNSDFKLWEKATTKELGGGRVEKTINLPWGIGEHTIILEGMTDAGKRRAAVGSYGQYIRGLIRDRTDDEAITSRAKSAAARSQRPYSEDGNRLGSDQGLRDTGVQEETVQAPSEAYQEDATGADDFRATLLARRAKVAGRIDKLTAEFDLACRDLKAIDAALSTMEVTDE